MLYTIQDTFENQNNIRKFKTSNIQVEFAKSLQIGMKTLLLEKVKIENHRSRDLKKEISRLIYLLYRGEQII